MLLTEYMRELRRRWHDSPVEVSESVLGLGLSQQVRLALALEEVGFDDGTMIIEEGASVGWDDTAMFYCLSGAHAGRTTSLAYALRCARMLGCVQARQ